MFVPPSSLSYIAVAAVAGLTLAVSAVQASAASDEARPNRIQFEYVPPQKPELERVYAHIKEGHALEKIQQLFNPFRLPIDLTVKTVGLRPIECLVPASGGHSLL